MASMTIAELQFVQSKINQLPRDRYELSEIYAEDWKQVACPYLLGRLVRGEIAAGRLKAHRIGGRRVILADSLRALISGEA